MSNDLVIDMIRSEIKEVKDGLKETRAEVKTGLADIRKDMEPLFKFKYKTLGAIAVLWGVITIGLSFAKH